MPCIEGLGAKAGPLVFQVSPLPRSLVEEPTTLMRISDQRLYQAKQQP